MLNSKALVYISVAVVIVVVAVTLIWFLMGHSGSSVPECCR